MRLAVALALIALALPAAAQTPAPETGERVELGVGLVCDTQEQVARYIELLRDDPKAAAAAVNAEVGQPEACTFGTVAFIRGAEVGRVRNNDDQPVRIAEILVVAVATESGLVQIAPVRWYTAFPVDELRA